MNTLFLTKYSKLGGSSKHMVYSYIEFYEQAGINCTLAPLFDDNYFSFRVLSRPATFAELATHADYLLNRMLNRLAELLRVSQFDVVVLEKEVLPYFPFGLEVILKKQQPKLVSLYDDAVHAHYAANPSPLVRWLCRDKIRRVIAISWQVIVWNDYLAKYARQFNPHVSVVNTGIDLRYYRLKSDQDRDPEGRVVIGWIGTPNSFPHIAALEEVFARLANCHNVELRVISSIEYESTNIRVSNRRWSLETEVDDLCSFDIGIMPLADNSGTRGKSAYKAVQYMGVGVPVVCSPVGVNAKIVQEGVNGFLASTPAEWFEKLSCLIEDPALRQAQGHAGRQIVEETYSVQAVAPRLVNILKSIA